MRYGIGFILAAALALAVACKDQAELTMKTLITDKVIEVAVASLAEDMQDERLSYVNVYGIIWTAGVNARHAVFAEHLGKAWFDLVYYERTDFRKRAMDLARASLDTPEELWGVYLAHKGTLISEIKKNGIEREVALRAQAILPHFRGEIINPEATDDGRGASGWIKRRRAEGGDELTKAYGEIIANLLQSL